MRMKQGFALALAFLLLGVVSGWVTGVFALDPIFAVNKNVYRPALDGPVTYVVRSPEYGEGGIWITNSAGEKIANPFTGYLQNDQPVTVTWTGDNYQGEPVATGIYLAYIRTPFERRILKLILIR
jgi:hypothetical protein